MFEIKPWNPETFRQQTRRSTLIIAVLFIVLAMALSTLAVRVLGEPGGDNFRYNLGGVIAAVVVSAALMKLTFWSQPWMAAAVYGWQLKRSLMRITNVMHQVTDGVAAGNPSAMKLLRFYHLGLSQMHELDANSSSHAQLVREMDQHKAAMEALGLETEQTRLHPEWLAALKTQA